jgi:hypothetical protein
MTQPDPPETKYVGEITTPPDSQGWQVTYEIGIQGYELVVMSVTERSLVGIPAGGLTAKRARALLKPGLAVREFSKAVREGKVTVPLSEADALELVATASEGGEAWQATSTPEFDEYVAWLRDHPALRRSAEGAVDRRQRIARTAALYVDAVGRGLRAPRKHVATEQGRSDGAVRDDLHAARTETPQLLTEVSKGHAGGRLTTEAVALLSEMAEGAELEAT